MAGVRARWRPLSSPAVEMACRMTKMEDEKEEGR
jgi:hypothetical protein